MRGKDFCLIFKINSLSLQIFLQFSACKSPKDESDREQKIFMFS
jgi:hypothetical protein